MKRLSKLLLIYAALMLVTACGSDNKEPKPFKPSSQQTESRNKTEAIPLAGDVTGMSDGKVFTNSDKKGRPGKITKSGGHQSLNLTFGADMNIVTINVMGYSGAGTYAKDSTSFQLINLKNHKETFSVEKDTKLTITEDNDSHVKGSLLLNMASKSDQKHLVEATFDLKKIKIDKNNPEALLAEIKDNPNIIRTLDKKTRADPEFILKAMKVNNVAFNYADPSLKKDKAFLLKAMEQNPKSVFFTFADSDIKKDKDFALKAVKVSNNVLYLLDSELKNDEDVVLAAIAFSPSSFNFANKRLKKDKGFILKALKKTPEVYEYIGGKLRADKDIKAAAKVK